MTIETKRHADIVWRVHDHIVANQGQFFHTEDLCQIFWGDFNASLEREMRLIIEEIVNDRAIQKIIIGTQNGYIHPRADQKELIETYIRAQESAAKRLFFRVGSVRYRLDKDTNYKAQIGKYDSPTYEAFLREIQDEVERELMTLPNKQYREATQPQMVMAEGGQMGFGI